MEGKPKSESLTAHDKESYAKHHQEYLGYWLARKGEYKYANELDNDFKLVQWSREGLKSIDLPNVQLAYLSDFGFIRLNLWTVNRVKSVLTFSGEIYSMGANQKTKGKGRQTVNSLNKILQSISDSTGYRVYYVASPNLKSAHLFPRRDGYSSFSRAEQDKQSKLAEGDDKFRLETLLRSSVPYDSKIKEYIPKANPNLSDREKYEMEIISQLALI